MHCAVHAGCNVMLEIMQIPAMLLGSAPSLSATVFFVERLRFAVCHLSRPIDGHAAVEPRASGSLSNRDQELERDQ